MSKNSSPGDYGSAEELAAPARMSKIHAVPDLVRKEGLALVISLAAVVIVSALWGAPLEGPASSNAIPAEGVKAPWIFVGIQETLRWMSPLVAGVILPVAGISILAMTPFIPSDGRRKRKSIAVVFFCLVLGWTILTICGWAR